MIADKNRKIAYVVLDPKVVFFSNFQRTLGLSSWTDLRCMISSTNNQATGWSDSSSSPSRDLITKFNLKEFFKPIQKSMPFYNGQKILKLFNLQTIICSRLLFGSYTIILENLSEWGKWYIYHPYIGSCWMLMSFTHGLIHLRTIKLWSPQKYLIWTPLKNLIPVSLTQTPHEANPIVPTCILFVFSRGMY